MLERGNLGREGQIYDLVIQNYRVVGICGLLHDGSSSEFLTNLQKSGSACAFLLPKLNDDNSATSKLQGFFASAACGDEEAARTISSKSRDSWNPELEHEDDFIFVRLLMDLFYRGASESDLMALANRLGEVTEGEVSPRREICQALLTKSSERFGEGLEEYILERRDYYAEQWDADYILEEEWATDGQIFVEGIALVRMARKLGLDTQAEYLFIPSLVLDRDAENRSPDSWRAVTF